MIEKDLPRKFIYGKSDWLKTPASLCLNATPNTFRRVIFKKVKSTPLSVLYKNYLMWMMTNIICIVISRGDRIVMSKKQT